MRSLRKVQQEVTLKVWTTKNQVFVVAAGTMQLTLSIGRQARASLSHGVATGYTGHCWPYKFPGLMLQDQIQTYTHENNNPLSAQSAYRSRGTSFLICLFQLDRLCFDGLRSPLRWGAMSVRPPGTWRHLGCCLSYPMLVDEFSQA